MNLFHVIKQINKILEIEIEMEIEIEIEIDFSSPFFS